MSKHPSTSTRRSPNLSVKLLAATILAIFIGLLYSFHLIPHRKYTNADFHIETYRSQNDQDTE